MSIRENEVRSRRPRKDITLTELAIEVVRDEPEASNPRLAHRMAAQVESDRSLLDLMLENGCLHEIVLARNALEKEQERAKAGTKKKEVLTKKQAGAKATASKHAARMRVAMVNFVAENGKQVLDLTGNDLLKLKTDNATRFNLYRELA